MKLVNKLLFTGLALSLFTACSSKDSSNKEANTSEEVNQSIQSTETETEANKNSNELEDRKYIVGLDDTFAPMGFRDEKGELVGFDIDLAKDVAERMGVEIDFLPIDWAMKETELDAGNIDFIWNGYSITDERKEKVAFSSPYIQDKQVIITLADSDINSKEDLKEKTITVQENSSALEAVNKDKEFLNELKDAPVEYATNVECFSDIENGRSDALIVDEVFGRYYIKTSGKEDKFKILEESLGIEDFAVGMRKGDTALVEAVNNALAQQKEDGTYDEIYAKWFAQ